MGRCDITRMGVKQRDGNEDVEGGRSLGSLLVGFKVQVGHYLSSKKGGLSNWDQPIACIQVYDCEKGFRKTAAVALLSEMYWFIPCNFQTKLMSTLKFNLVTV